MQWVKNLANFENNANHVISQKSCKQNNKWSGKRELSEAQLLGLWCY